MHPIGGIGRAGGDGRRGRPKWGKINSRSCAISGAGTRCLQTSPEYQPVKVRISQSDRPPAICLPHFIALQLAHVRVGPHPAPKHTETRSIRTNCFSFRKIDPALEIDKGKVAHDGQLYLIQTWYKIIQ